MKTIIIFFSFCLLLSNKSFARIGNDTMKVSSKFKGNIIVKKIKGVKRTYQMDSTLFVFDYNTQKDFLKLFEQGIMNGTCFVKRHSGNINFWGEYYEWKKGYKYGKPPYIGNFKGTYIMVSNPKKIVVNKNTGYITYSFVTYYCYGTNETFDEYELTVNPISSKNEDVKIISLVYTGTPI